MTTSAPTTRLVNALNGQVAARPDQFRKALSEADAFCREVESAHELRTRIEELECEVDVLAGKAEYWEREARKARKERDRALADVATYRSALSAAVKS